jgi:hypothetical protein
MKAATKTTKAPVVAQKQRKKPRKTLSSAQKEVLAKNAFQPGQSGNPGGRPGGVSITSSLLRELAKQVRAGVVNADAVAESMVREAIGGNVSAFIAIADRTEGKPVNRTELTGKDGKPLIDDQSRAEAAIELLMQRIGCSREVAAKELAPFMPEVSKLVH